MEQEAINSEGCGKYFFHFLPMVVGLCYGIFERGVILKQWWLEAILVAVVILLMHVTFGSWLFIGCRQEIKEINVKSSLSSKCIFIGAVTAEFICVFAILAIVAKWPFGLR